MCNVDPDSFKEASGASEIVKTRDRAIDQPSPTKTTSSEHEAREATIERAREVGAPLEIEEQQSTGGGNRPPRLLLIGLDGATPELALGAWRGELPTLERLTGRGLSGRTRGSVPWASLPAWLCLLSGQNPGQLGVYGPTRRPNHSYAAPLAVDSRAIHAARLWDLLGSAGKHVGVVSAPGTTPAPPVHGHLVGDSLRPDGAGVYPSSLRRQIAAWLEDTPFAQPALAGSDTERSIQAIYTRTEQRFLLARRMLARDSYDCFVLVDDGIAAIQRLLWDTLDPAHPRYRSGDPFAGAIGSFYRFVDSQIAEILDLVDADTIVAVVSACGAQSLAGEFALNDWLLSAGELVLDAPPARPVALEHCAVDWARTRAWAGDTGAIYLNVAGREPRGTIPADQLDQVRASIAERLRALTGPDRRPAGLEVYHPGTFYAVAHGIAPDLLVTCRQPGWRPTARLGYDTPWISALDTHMEAACESQSGFLVLYDPRDRRGQREISGATIFDIAPTLLDALGEPVPPRLRGRSLLRD